MICRYCQYKWNEREKEPKSCPRCKRRFDYPNKKVKVKKQKTEEKPYTKHI